MLLQYEVFTAMLLLVAASVFAQVPAHYLLKTDSVFDGDTMHSWWQVLVKGNKIEAVCSHHIVPANTLLIDLLGTTLMHSMMEGHSHLFLHPCNETS